MRNGANLITLLTLSIFIFGCKKVTEQYPSDPVTDYIPSAVGKYIIYRLDSTVFTNFGSTIEVHSYHEKDSVDAQIPDALGRPSYRILRYLRDVTDTLQWQQSSVFWITPTAKTVEVMENNLRMIKLSLPIVNGFTWQGNHFLNSHPYNDIYSNWNNDADMNTWPYSYDSVGATITLNGKTINNTITVNGVNELLNWPVTNPTIPDASINFLQEKYAKGIGLVYQQFIMKEYQYNNGIGYYKGFGVTRTMIDHN